MSQLNNTSPDAAIIVKDVVKTFKLPHERHNSVKSLLAGLHKRRTYELQRALNGVSFEIKKGEFFGIVGRNGSGKSTLLKLLASIYVPDAGEIKIRGSLTPFIELGVGFNPELTARENVYLNSALLGFNRKEVNAMYDDIVEFAELERFMDQKLKNFSSGMQVRLAFSIAIRAHSDILLLDEVLAVGDAAFQQKCFDYFAQLKEEKKTIILVSHSMALIERFCDRALLLEGGKVKAIGPSSQITSQYEEMFLEEEAARYRKARAKSAASKARVEVTGVEVLQAGKPVKRVDGAEDFELKIGLRAKQDFKSVNLAFNIKNRDRQILVSMDTYSQQRLFELKKNQPRSVTFKVQNVLADGLYVVNLGVAEQKTAADYHALARKENAQEFMVHNAETHGDSLVRPAVDIEIS